MKKLLVALAAVFIAFGSGTFTSAYGEDTHATRIGGIHITFHNTTDSTTFHTTGTQTEATV